MAQILQAGDQLEQVTGLATKPQTSKSLDLLSFLC